jgi:hypothetical protein
MQDNILELFKKNMNEKNDACPIVPFKIYFNSIRNLNTADCCVEVDIGLCLWFFDGNMKSKGEGYQNLGLLIIIILIIYNNNFNNNSYAISHILYYYSIRYNIINFIIFIILLPY